MKVYLDTVREVLETGTRRENRTGVDTLSSFNINYEIDLAPGFPLLTTKAISWKNIVVENLWFLSGVPDIGLLRKHGCRFWDPWADEDGRVPSAYGNFWRRFPVHENGEAAFNDQIAWVLEELKKNPLSRRLLVSAWAPGNAQRSRLPPCHALFALNVQNGRDGIPRLNLHLTQRSCDVALGIPYNIAGYALLLELFSHFTGLRAGIFAHTLDRCSRLYRESGRLDGGVRPRARIERATEAGAEGTSAANHLARASFARRHRSASLRGHRDAALALPARRLRPSSRDLVQGGGLTSGIIAAVSPEGVIGVDGHMPWHYSEDLKRFKRLTLGSTVIMGRLTWESLPKKPLVGRRNIVITRRKLDGVECFSSLDAALATCEGDVWFIGGTRLFVEAMKHADLIDLAYVPDSVAANGAVYFPEIPESDWEAGPLETHPDDPRLKHRVHAAGPEPLSRARSAGSERA